MEAKDIKRIQDLKNKSYVDGSFNLEKAESLANHMANLIKDREKCYRRMSAATSEFGFNSPITQIFLRRWHILNGNALVAPKPVAPPKEEVEVVKSIQPDLVWGSELENPGGETVEDDLNLKAGKIVKGTLEIWETWSKEIVHLYTEEKTPRVKIGESSNFYQNGKYIFGGEMKDWVDGSHSEAAVKKYGNPSIIKSYA